MSGFTASAKPASRHTNRVAITEKSVGDAAFDKSGGSASGTDHPPAVRRMSLSDR
jgi:hypothetical protein